jgi:hypothetical protein
MQLDVNLVIAIYEEKLTALTREAILLKVENMQLREMISQQAGGGENADTEDFRPEGT